MTSDQRAAQGAGPIGPARPPRTPAPEPAPWWQEALQDGSPEAHPAPHPAPHPNPRPALPPRLSLAAFGQRLELQAPPWPFLRADTAWRLRQIYEPALAAAVLPATGLAVDIGAGFGGFALPFARAFPGWTVWCFEPEPEAQAALAANIAALGLDNVIALPLAVGGTTGPGAAPDEALDLGALAGVLAGLAGGALPEEDAGDLAALLALCPARSYRQDPEKPGVLEAGAGDLRLPTLPAAALAVLAPGLVKLTAPQAEPGILEDLASLPLDHLIGEIWAQVPSALVHAATPGQRQTWLPLAGRGGLALRRGPGMPLPGAAAPAADWTPATPAVRTDTDGIVLDATGRRHGLDVVVAMFNAADWIDDCLEGVLSGPADEIRALVIDDGSTDGSAEHVRARWGSDPRVRLHSKPNGGCASARNYGRLMSDRTHIAFVDADDVPDPMLFPELLELARYTGAELVQGAFHLLHPTPGGGLLAEPSYEAAALADLPTEPFGFGLCRRVPAGLLITGQPSIWRRVARRDFLDNRNIWFPEHIRAFDDQIFQLLSLQHAGEVPMLDHVSYGYRQHPGQDIRQGDDRAFASLEMFRMLLRRAIDEGWDDLAPPGRSLVNTLNWSGETMRPDLRPRFVQAAAELWVLAERALHGLGHDTRPGTLMGQPDTAVALPDFTHHTASLRHRLAGLPSTPAWALLDSVEMHPPLIRSLPPR